MTRLQFWTAHKAKLFLDDDTAFETVEYRKKGDMISLTYRSMADDSRLGNGARDVASADLGSRAADPGRYRQRADRARREAAPAVRRATAFRR